MTWHIRIRRAGSALQEPDGGKAEQHGRAKERRRLSARELLNVADDLRHIAVPHRLRDVVELRCGLADILARLRQIAVELGCGAADHVGDVADIIGARGFLVLQRAAQFLAGIGRHVLGGFREVGRLAFHRIHRAVCKAARLALDVAAEVARLPGGLLRLLARIGAARLVEVRVDAVHSWLFPG